MIKTKAITLIKADVLATGRTVHKCVQEVILILSRNIEASFERINILEEEVNQASVKTEQYCLDILTEYQDLTAQEVHTLIGSVLIVTKLERLADHAHRVAKLVLWAADEHIELPGELLEMAQLVNRMLEEVLLLFISDEVEKVAEIAQQDSNIDFLHDLLSKKLLLELGEQDQQQAQINAQLLFCSRYLERMGDYCTSIAKRIYLMVTGKRLD